MPETPDTPPPPPPPADRTTTIARSLDSIATRGAARAWLAALLRIAALWYSIPILYRLPQELTNALQQFLNSRSRMRQYPEFDTAEARVGMVKEFWDNGGSSLLYLLIWVLIAWKAGRIAVWVFPLKRHCLRCGYTIGRVSKTTPATPCPECGEGQSATPSST